MTFSIKILCLGFFLFIAYGLDYQFTGGAVPTMVNALALLAAAAWCVYALRQRYQATRLSPPPQRSMSRSDIAYWHNQPRVRYERNVHLLTRLATLAAAVLMVLAVAFIIWQAAAPFLSYGQATLVSLAIAAAMVFCTDAAALVQKRAFAAR